MDYQSIKPYLDEQSVANGFSHWGQAPLERPLTIEFYDEWINSENHGDMDFLRQHQEIKKSPQKKWSWARSSFVFGAPYYPNLEDRDTLTKEYPLRLSLYARGRDYHGWFQQKLETVAKGLQEMYPEAAFLCCTDSSPILERDLAYRAGLGWFGKNTCLIHPKHGSLFFLGEIITSLPFYKENFSPPEKKSPLSKNTLLKSDSLPTLPDFCGKCTRCIEACPTQAITGERQIDARRCISYLTIESKGIPPVELREQMGDWFFGCDICQLVCPWNQKTFGDELKKHLPSTNEDIHKIAQFETPHHLAELRLILTSSNKFLEKRFFGTPLQRARGWRLKRNALLIIGNNRIKQLSEETKALLNDSRLGELAAWTMSKLQNSELLK